MGYHDYWDGDCEMARYYRDMDEKVKERQNEALWLQGLYFYEALVDASPVLNANRTAEPYWVDEGGHPTHYRNCKVNLIDVGE